MTSVFNGLTVVDASAHLSGNYATRLLADHGAHVELVETDAPVIGRSARQFGEPDDPAVDGALFRHLNAGKRLAPISVTGGESTTESTVEQVERLITLCSGADVAVVSSRGLANAIVRRSNGSTLVAIIDDFGEVGPYAGWSGSELIFQALSGSMFANGAASRAPLYGCGNRAYYAAGTFLYVSIVAAMIGRLNGGTFGTVEVSVHEAAAAMEQNFTGQWSYNRSIARRDEQLRTKGRLKGVDGWVIYFVRPGQWRAFCTVFDADHLVDDPRFDTWSRLVANWKRAAAELAAAGSSRSVAEIMKLSDEFKLVVAPVLEPADLFDDEQLRVREFWQTVDGQRSLGPVFRMDVTPARRDRPAPARGDVDHVDHIDRPGVADAGSAAVSWLGRREAAAAPGPDRPLAGIRVLDLTAAWAGPMATRMLGLLGADIVKVEGPTRLDGWRGAASKPPSTHDYPDFVPGDRPYDRHCWFNSQNHDKRSIVIDLKHPDGVKLALDLAASSDVVIANYSAGALDRMGLGHSVVGANHAEVVVVEMPAMGSGGPLANMRGLGPTMEAMAGISSLIGEPDLGPMGSGTAYLDPVGALHGAAATVTGLIHALRTGVGQRIEVAQREAAMHWIGEILLAADAGAPAPVCVGNDRPGRAPHGAYPADGIDNWIAIDAGDDDDFVLLCAALDAPELATDDRFTDAAGRWDNRRQLNEALAALTCRHDRHVFACRLQAAGVAAAAVYNGADMVADPHLAAHGWFTALDHPEAGRHAYAGLPFVFDGRRYTPRRAAPGFGQHNAEVLAELLHLSPAAINELDRSGLISSEPVVAT